MANARFSPSKKSERKGRPPVSSRAQDKANTAKAYIEQKYSKLKRIDSEKREG